MSKKADRKGSARRKAKKMGDLPVPADKASKTKGGKTMHGNPKIGEGRAAS